MNPDAFFRALADLTRLRLLLLLADGGELCVCELTHAVDAPQPKVSRHLALLRQTGVLADRRQGLWVYYRLHPELPPWARAVISESALGLAGEAPFAADRLALAEMPNRPGGACCA